MALICDTGGIYAMYDADDGHHDAVKAVVEAEPGTLYLPTILLAEIDYLLNERLGVDATLDFLASVESGAFTLVDPTSENCFAAANWSNDTATCRWGSPMRP